MKKILFSMCLMATAAFFSACKDDDDNSVASEFNAEGTKYALTDGYVYFQGDVDANGSTYHQWSVVLVSDGITYSDGFNGTGDVVRLELYTTEEGTVPAGTYDMGGTEKGALEGMVFLNLNLDEGTNTKVYDDFDDIETIVNKSGDAHTIKFTLTQEDGSKITGSFKGNLTTVTSL